MVKQFLIICVFGLAANAFAEPKQLDIIGIVPGKSTQADIDKMQGKKLKNGDINLIIGGYILQCGANYFNGVLLRLFCITGRKHHSMYNSILEQQVEFYHYYSRDATSGEGVLNIKVHEVLLKGFTKKFGKPTESINEIVTNGFGQEFGKNTAMWIDKAGNKLVISSLHNEVELGLLTLESAEKLKADKMKEEAREF